MIEAAREVYDMTCSLVVDNLAHVIYLNNWFLFSLKHISQSIEDLLLLKGDLLLSKPVVINLVDLFVREVGIFLSIATTSLCNQVLDGVYVDPGASRLVKR